MKITPISGTIVVPAPKRLPKERPSAMFFRFWGDNPFVVTDTDARSTFAADVDTASFTLAERMLKDGMVPAREQIRTEEFVNFSRADMAPPTKDTFALHGELAPSPFGGREDRWLLRVGLRAAEIDRDQRPALALTFVVDTSGSMKENNRLELVKHAMRLLVGERDARDSIAIVRFSNQASEVLPPTSAAARDAPAEALACVRHAPSAPTMWSVRCAAEPANVRCGARRRAPTRPRARRRMPRRAARTESPKPQE